jgi:TolA-binding protein
MQGIRVRRLPSLLLSLLALLPLVSGCKLPEHSAAPTATASSSDEAERTRKIQEKAAEIERKQAELQTMQGTDQEKIDAANEIEKLRQELTQMQESGGKN